MCRLWGPTGLAGQRAGLARPFDVDAGGWRQRGVVLRNVRVDFDVDSSRANEGQVLAYAILCLGSKNLDLLVDDREARELMCALTFIGTRHSFLKSCDRLFRDADVHTYLHHLVGDA